MQAQIPRNYHEERILDDWEETNHGYLYRGMSKSQIESKTNQSIYILKNIFLT